MCIYLIFLKSTPSATTLFAKIILISFPSLFDCYFTSEIKSIFGVLKVYSLVSSV